MIAVSFLALLSTIISILAIFLAISIFNKVYQEDYKKPWLFIGITAIFFALAQILEFLGGFFSIYIVNYDFSNAVGYILEFIAIVTLTYALVLEFLILKYYHGKFVKMKFLPVQEGSLGGKFDINITNGVSYVAIKKDRDFIFGEFSKATQNGFEGFLIGQKEPSKLRLQFNLQKTPIAWINSVEIEDDTDYLKGFLDENSDIVDPLQLNNLISFIDNFLEQSQNPFIALELDLILKNNNFDIVFEFLKYISNNITKRNGIFICLLNSDLISKNEVIEIKDLFTVLE